MSNMNIVTGTTGAPHVKSADMGALNAGIVSIDNIVLPTGQQFKAVMTSSTNLRIESGDLLINGRHARIEYGQYEDVAIEQGTVGLNRVDLVVAEYRKLNGIESVFISVIQGDSASGNAETPSHIAGNIYQHDIRVQFPLYKIIISGINVTNVIPLFTISKSITTIYNLINQEVQNRKVGDSKIIDSINQEIQNRKTGDSTLTDSINQEIQDRKAGDENLNNALKNEVNDRKNADNTLQDMLNALTKRIEALEKK